MVKCLKRRKEDVSLSLAMVSMFYKPVSSLGDFIIIVKRVSSQPFIAELTVLVIIVRCWW